MTMFTNTNTNKAYYTETPINQIDFRNGNIAKLKFGVPSVTRAKFVLSKLRLQIAAIHKYQSHPQGHYMVFTLDPACTNVVLKAAKGVWHTQPSPQGQGATRVWLLCEAKVSRMLPVWIMNYAAKKAMPRATGWLRLTVESNHKNKKLDEDAIKREEGRLDDDGEPFEELFD